MHPTVIVAVLSGNQPTKLIDIQGSMKELSTYIQNETTLKNLINDNESIYLIDYEMLTIVNLQMEAGFLFVVSDAQKIWPMMV